jgi:hypothetical protein
MEQAVQVDQPESFIDLSRASAEFDLAKWMMAVKRAHGKGHFSQMLDVRKVKRGPGKIIALEYYIFRLYDDSLFDHKAKLEFCGEAGRPSIYTMCNDHAWAEIEQDKLASADLLAGQGFPMPETFALFHPDRSAEGLRSLAKPSDCADYLRNGAPYPFFGKPLDACESVGVVSVQGYDAAADCLALRSGRQVPVDDFVEKVGHFQSGGYIFQKRLEPGAAMAALVGDRLSTVRLMVQLKDSGPELFRPVWKIPVGDNVADNVWRDGNLLAAIDPATGTAKRAIIGLGPDEVEVESHPDTGERLAGAVIPDWHAMTELCLEAARHFPGLRLQAWDVAATSRGPVILEINGAGDLSMTQRAEGRGVLDTEFLRFLGACRDAKQASGAE